MHFMNDLANAKNPITVCFDLCVVELGVEVPSRSVPAAH